MDGVGILEDEVRELIRRRGIDPVRDRPGVTALVDEAIADYDAAEEHFTLYTTSQNPHVARLVRPVRPADRARGARRPFL